MRQILHVLLRSLTTIWRVQRYYYYHQSLYVHFTDEETEAQKGRKWLLHS